MNNNSYYMVPPDIRNDIRKIKQYQKTKATVLNGEINKLLNSLNKFNNEYSKLVTNVEQKLLETNNVSNYNSNNVDMVQTIQNNLINQLIKLNNIFSAMNNYIDNLQTFIDQNQLNPNSEEIQRVEESRQIEETASQMAMTFISNLMSLNNNETNT